MTNFDFLLAEPQFKPFADVAIAAEKILHIDPTTTVINCRRTMEFAIKWMYSVDSSLEKPYDDKLVMLMNSEDFRDIVGADLWQRLNLIRLMGNKGNHKYDKKNTVEEASLCLENLHIFMDFVAYCYGDNYTEKSFDASLLVAHEEMPAPSQVQLDFEKLLAENKALREELTARREQQQQTYVPKPLELSEYKTRKIYIDAMLRDAGWVETVDWVNEVPIPGMPNKSELGFADYVLYGNDWKVLAIIEAKRTCVDVSKGRQQAEEYAKLIEKKQGFKPVIFLTNGFETRINDGVYPERKVATIYSKRDLEKLFNLRRMRSSLKHVVVDKNIAGRYYQEAAIKAVCESFGVKNRRKALLVMATGSGKTRTVIALCDVLQKQGWIKHVLFLADRNSLVTQAKRNFVNLLPNMSVTNLCEEKDNYAVEAVFSTYQTMMNCIDEVKDEQGKLFTCGHFDLVICDEAHRSIYNKYRDIFNYFDAPLVGLTATPKDEIDKNTYEIFELQNGVPTYGYELAQAVKDGYLVDYVSVESHLKFLTSGIRYDELSPEEQKIYEATFANENGEYPESIAPSALNNCIFNEDTIRKVLNTLMTDGIKIDYGNKLGKSIIFAKNHTHAEKILEIFGKEYPHLPGFAKVIDNYINYAQSAIDEFSDAKKLPQIAISVDMLDTGIDVPEILNLVFFKPVFSKAKFWQMIGRGTRLCAGLLDGEDKNKFYIFDFCGNFEFFRMNQGKPTANQIALQGAIFNLKAQIAFKLQDLAYQTKDLIAFRKSLVADMVAKVQELNKENFAVHQHLRYVELYSNPENYVSLSLENTNDMREHLASLVTPDADDPKALRFDALMYGIELAYLAGKGYGRGLKDLFNKASDIARVANIPEIIAKSDLLEKILRTDYVEKAGINEFEHIRKNLRDLVKYIIPERDKYFTNFTDDVLGVDWNDAELENDDLKNYKAKAEFYVRKHPDHIAIFKLRSNKPLNSIDLKSLEDILWIEVGTREDYRAEYGEKPLGEFVREIVGMDMNAAKEAFAEFLNDTSLDSRQIYFVNQIVEYIVHNGILKDMSVLQETPFTDRGSIVEIFTDLNVWNKLRGAIERVNANAVA
ncbi:MAG: DEAD/DEAH box helicase family protein [Phascolarctobacterium sp.]|nr:DEAD/DEAH box helicase family protein [Phascolarctobacterium sp.]